MDGGSLRRRDFLRLGGTALAGLAAASCAPGAARLGPSRPAGAPPGGHVRPVSRGPFVPPRVSTDRVVRTVYGFRPFRPAGFVVRAERRGEKLLIHNYGHGGGGVSLSWGSAHLALGEVGDVADKRAAVLGCGVMGLSTARLLQDRGWTVTVFARDLPPHTTSNVAGALWGPTSLFEQDRLTPAFEAQFREAARVAHHAFQHLVGSGYGVRWIERYALADELGPLPYEQRVLADLYPGGTVDLRPGEHPFPRRFARRVMTLMIEPGPYLRRLLSDFRQAGGTLVVRELRHVSEVMALDAPVVFNCTGLGAGLLFGDSELIPIKGQLAFLPPDPAVDFATIGGGGGNLYMFPRSDGILLGGTFQRGVGTPGTDAGEIERIVRGHQALFAGMR